MAAEAPAELSVDKDQPALAGGVRGGKKLKAVIPGGASAAMLTAKEVENLPMDFEYSARSQSARTYKRSRAPN